jgi:hypothetical protein
VGAFGEQVVGAAVGATSGAGIEAECGGLASDRGGDGAGLTVQDCEGLLGDPLLGGGVAFGKERSGLEPQVLQHVDEVADDGDLDAVGSGLSLDEVDLVLAPSTRTTQVRLTDNSDEDRSERPSDDVARFGFVAAGRAVGGVGRSVVGVDADPHAVTPLAAGEVGKARGEGKPDALLSSVLSHS